MADLVSPDQVRARSFRTTWRGYDQTEVAEFLDRVARTIEMLDRERARLSSSAGREPEGDLQTEFQRVSAEIGDLLESARVAAENMRRRASEDAAQWRRLAEEEAEKARSEAQADAEALRGDAWTVSASMLSQSQELAGEVAAQAEREALAIVGHSERESHRQQAAARREADEQLRIAKMEAERLLVDAHAQHDEIIETARKQAEAAQERARALEVRRDELLAELETVRGKIHEMETDIEERREPVSPEAAQTTTVRLIPNDSAAESETKEWTPADTVRVIPAARRSEEAESTVDAASLADEVRRLRDEAALSELAGDADEPEPEDVEDLEAEPDSDPDEAEVSIEEPTAPPVPDGDPEPGAGSEDVTWALDSLFATLRSEPEPQSAAASEYPVEETSDRSEPTGEPAVAPSLPPEATEQNALSERDRLLLPISNRVLRGVKRQLTEAQNLTLEDIRVNERWDAGSVDLVERVRGDLVVLVQESFAAGQAAAGDYLGAETGRPKPEPDDVPDHSEGFAADLIEALSSVAGAASEQGPRALSASLSRVYRAWRTDEAERRLREYSKQAFHRGLLAGAREAGAETVVWVLAGRGCSTCRAVAQIGPVDIGSDFPGIDGVPPAHPGCECSLVPGIVRRA